MAPERFYGQYSVSSDLYAVGVLLFELLVGYRPFSGMPMEMMSAHLNHPVNLPATMPTVLQTVILTALQKLPARRFQTATDMLSAVQTAAATVKDDREWTGTRLLRPPAGQPARLCQYVQQETLQARVQQLVTVAAGSFPQTALKGLAVTNAVEASQPVEDGTDQVYQVHKKHINCRSYGGRLLAASRDVSVAANAFAMNGLAMNGLVGNGLAGNGRSLFSSVWLPQAVKELLVRPQGCFVISQRSIYRVPIELFQTGSALPSRQRLQHASSGTPLGQGMPKLIAEFSSDFFVAIEAKGRWMATAVLEPDRVTSLLSIWNLLRLHDTSRLQLLQPVSRKGEMVMAARLTAHLFHLAMADSRYVVAFSHVLDKSTQSYITGVLLEVFTRRGNPVSAFSLPVPLQQLLASPTPYRMMALEPGHPHSVLLINLKPLRLVRVGVDIVPLLLASASWGYVLMAADGHIVVLNQYGQTIGRMIGPANPTAIAVLEPHGLLIATWAEGQGVLVTIDLRQIGVELGGRRLKAKG